MTIASGGLIQASDYNNLRTTVSNLLGTTGSGDTGYGQTITADTPVVANTTLISADPTTTKQWVALYNDIKKIADHQGTSITALQTAYANNIKSGSVINYSDINLISTTIATLTANRFNIANTQYSDESFLTSTRTTAWGSPSKSIVQHSFNVVFASADDARYFFNAGGQIRLTPSLTNPPNVTPQITDWQTMLTNIGTVVFNYNSTSASSGTPGGGFYQLTTTPQQIYTKGGIGGTVVVEDGVSHNYYAANDYTITASKNGGVITFDVYFKDDDKNKSNEGYGLYDIVEGTLTNAVSLYRPSGSNVSVLAPSGTNTVLLSDGVIQSYVITPNSTSISEGGTVTYTITTSDIGSATLYWTNSGSTSSGDFSDGVNSGTVTITNNSGTFTRTLVNDLTTEGSENIIINLRTDSISGTIVATASTVTVIDSSITSSPSFVVSPVYSAVDEGNSLTFNVSGSNITNGVYYWTVTNTGDFGTSSGFFNITNNAGSFTLMPTADFTIEGSETFTVSIRSGSISGSVLATSASVTINDTSVPLPPTATYSVSPAASNVNEGSNLIFNVSGTNITNGTYYWTVTNTGDFGTSSGAFTITNNSGSFTVTPTADFTIEGSETFTASIRSGSTGGTVLATSGSVTINDTSIPLTPTYSVVPAYSSVNEGNNLTFNVSGTNITNGTYYYTVSYITADTGDFNALTASNYFTITSNSGSFFVTVLADHIPEGTETFTVSLRSGSTSGPVLATSSTVTINDTSAGIAITYPTTAVYGTPFTWSIAGGYANETWTATWSGAFSGSASGTLDETGAKSYSDGSFGQNEGTVTVIWTFSQSLQTPSRTITNSIPTFTRSITISSDTADFNLHDNLVSAGWNGSMRVNATVTVNSGVYVYATSTSGYAFNISSIPSGSTISLTNNGSIVGKGGTGGAGGTGNVTPPGKTYPGTGFDGGSGGPALYVAYATSIVNNGMIGGGGGGGGGGSFGNAYSTQYGGGGGGGGKGNGIGGLGGVPTNGSTNISGGNGQNGTLTTVGNGGVVPTIAYNGGNGGSYGSSGNNGTEGSSYGGAGGPPGAALVGKSFVNSGSGPGGLIYGTQS